MTETVLNNCWYVVLVLFSATYMQNQRAAHKEMLSCYRKENDEIVCNIRSSKVPGGYRERTQECNGISKCRT